MTAKKTPEQAAATPADKPSVSAAEMEEFRQFQAMKSQSKEVKDDAAEAAKVAKARDDKIAKLKVQLADISEELSGMGIHILTAALKLRHKEWVIRRSQQLGIDPQHLIEKIVREAYSVEYTKGGLAGGATGLKEDFNPITGQYG